MKKKVIIIGGEHRTARPLTPGEAPVPGDLLREREGRRVYRYLCDDGSDAVLRNVRYPDRIAAYDAASLCDEFLLVDKPMGSSPTKPA